MTDVVRLDEGDLLVARHWAAELLATGLERTPNYSGIHRPDRFFTGYVGELAFAAWMRQMSLMYRHRVTLGGHSDAPEFIAWRQGKATSIDVKTASLANYTRLMMPQDQLLDAHLYVAARIMDLDAGLVELMGWLDGQQLQACEVRDFGHGPTRSCAFADMRSMRDMIGVVDAMRVVRRA